MSELPIDVKYAIVVVMLSVFIAACFEPIATFAVCSLVMYVWALARLIFYFFEGR